MRDRDLANVIVFSFFTVGFVVVIFYYHIKQQKMFCFKEKERSVEYSLF